MTYYPPDIIDNDAAKLDDALCRTIREGGQRTLDIATGYFAPTVWHLVGAAFGELTALRLLLGERPDVGYGGHDTLDLRRYYRHKIAGDLAAMAFDRTHARLVDDLVAFLERASVDVRLFAGPFLHAKAYIFERVHFVGSGNFTIPGLTRNSELLLAGTGEGASRALHEWFANKWAESADYKDELMATLRASKFGSQPYTPFEVFIKALYEYFKDRINLDEEREAAVDLARFQEEGKAEALRLLDKWGGVLIADAVGLGKTYIGLSLLEHELILKRRKRRVLRGLVVCPAQLRDLIWDEKIRDFALPAAVISQEELGREDFDWKRYADVDVVLVDESHNFRNPGTNRYTNLSKLITSGKRKRVILMTATPVNNSLYDLYYQIRLLAHANDHHFRSLGISNLQGYFKAANQGGLEIFDLLEETTVRRSRADIRRRQDAGEEVIVNGRPVHFPARQLARIDYDLDGTYQGFYGELVAAIERLHCVAYNIEAFARTKTEATAQADQRNTALIALMKMLYLKRLESSAAAFAASITRQAQFQAAFLAQLRAGRLLNAASYRALQALAADDARDNGATEALLHALPAVDPAAYDMERIARLVETDLATLQTVMDLVARAQEQAARAGGDDKLRQIKECLAGEYRGQKVLIFTSYHDTARYLADQLRADADWRTAAGRPEIGVITGATKGDERQALIGRFAPLANPTANHAGPPLQILISTDVLAEGQNLQDAGTVINYDLHWNPVRLIQRAGRVDRIGSAFPQITLANVFPEAGLEELLGLVKRLADRITTIDRTVGLDASVLGEMVTDRSLDQLRRLHGNDQKLLSDLETQAELLSTEEMKFPLVAYMQQIGKRVVEDIPLGIHSARRYLARDSKTGTFLAFNAGDRHFWRFYPADGGAPLTHIRAIYPMIACDREEARLSTPAEPPFALIERATQDILATLRGHQAKARTRPPLSGTAQKLYNWLNRPHLWTADHAPDATILARLNAVFHAVPLKPYERDATLKGLIRRYEEGSDFIQLVTDLDAFFADNALYQESDADVSAAVALKEEDLRLVCYEHLIGG